MRFFVPILAAFLAATPAHAQSQGYPFSQRGSVSQMIAFTEITVAYGRPIARGRLLFADTGLVKYNQIWHPGADSATRVTISQPIEIEGREVKAGEYSLWLLPRENGQWSFILSSAARVFHNAYPGEGRDALRVDVTTERGAHMETLAIYFPQVIREEAILRVHWGETMVPVKIRAPYKPGQEAVTNR
jgi:hypothetical protein